jgi:hypothetical protein
LRGAASVNGGLYSRLCVALRCGRDDFFGPNAFLRWLPPKDPAFISVGGRDNGQPNGEERRDAANKLDRKNPGAILGPASSNESKEFLSHPFTSLLRRGICPLLSEGSWASNGRNSDNHGIFPIYVFVISYCIYLLIRQARETTREKKPETKM